MLEVGEGRDMSSAAALIKYPERRGVVEVDDEVYAALEARREWTGETHNDILRRVLSVSLGEPVRRDGVG